MDLAKAIAFGAMNVNVPMEKYLTYEASTEGLSMLPVVTVPTNPMSGSKTNDVPYNGNDGKNDRGCHCRKSELTKQKGHRWKGVTLKSVLMLEGSHRRNGNSAILSGEFARGAECCRNRGKIDCIRTRKSV